MRYRRREVNIASDNHGAARFRGPQAGAGQANGPALLRFGWTVSDNELLCQPDLQGVDDRTLFAQDASLNDALIAFRSLITLSLRLYTHGLGLPLTRGWRKSTCLKLDRRAIQSNIAFIPEDQVPIHCSCRGVDTDHPQR